MNEKLSAFVDNELSEIEERRVFAEINGDPGLRATWGRYHLIRAALRKELDHVAPAGLCGTVARAIAAEPVQRYALARRLGKVVGGLAIAATVATVAILNFPTPLTPSRDTAPVASNRPATAVAARTEARPSAATHPLNAYLVEHNEFAPTAGMGNMLPYVRSVKHDNNP
jgi:sigma-E factor negative regulatory protein RseA